MPSTLNMERKTELHKRHERWRDMQMSRPQLAATEQE
jgi:hypothetical protein